MYRRIAIALAMGVAAAALHPARAMINPSYTPVQLVRDARRIVAGKLRAATRTDRWALADVRTLKGAKAAQLRLSLAIAHPTDTREARSFLQSAEGSEAILFQAEQASFLPVSTIWMEVRAAAGGGFVITEFRDQRLPKTYAGSPDKLAAMAEYILHDPNADVPVEAGVRWSRRVRVGRLPGPPAGMAVLPGGRGCPDRLLLAGSDGDRLFAFDGKGDRFEDQTREAGLDTASKAWALVDLNRDGLEDLVSWDGAQLRALLGDKTGAFTPAGSVRPWPLARPCDALTVLSPKQDGSPGLLVGRDWPELLTWVGKGWKRGSLPGDKALGPTAGASSRCVAADWDGDGYVDVLQVRRQDSLLWRGTQDGFAEPKVSSVRGGEFPMCWCAGDFDTDGRLDLLVCGRNGSELWENAGNCRFRPVARFAGSLGLLGPGVTHCLAADLNHDGRPDVVTVGLAGQFAYHFNRGYRCLADEGDLALDAGPSTATRREALRAVRVVAGDFNGDGCLDLAAASAGGEAFCYVNGRSADQPEPPGVRVRLPMGRTGPVTVSVWQGDSFPVCVGTYLIDGHQPTYITLRSRGRCVLKWRWPGGKPRERKATERSDVILPLDSAP